MFMFRFYGKLFSINTLILSLAILFNVNAVTAQSVLTTIPLGPQSGNGVSPRGIGVNPITNRIYVANPFSNNVSVNVK